MTSFAYRVPLGALLLLAAGPALADHMGPSGFGSGGGMSVFSPDTLDGGHWAAGLRLTYTRPGQRSDATLEALAARHIHAHNTDYNFNASVGIAYGVSHHLTISAELPYVRRDDLREGEHEPFGRHGRDERRTAGERRRDRRPQPACEIPADRRARPGFALIAGSRFRPEARTG